MSVMIGFFVGALVAELIHWYRHRRRCKLWERLVAGALHVDSSEIGSTGPAIEPKPVNPERSEPSSTSREFS